MAVTLSKVEWNTTIMEHGVLSVMMGGTQMMLKSSVDNLGWEKQWRLKLMPTLVKDKATQCSPMLTALVMNQLLVGAYILDGGG